MLASVATVPLLVVALCSDPVGVAAAPAPIGFVADLCGEWTDSNGQPVYRGQRMSAKDKLSLRSNAAPGSAPCLVIVLTNGQTRGCDGAKACSAGVALPDSVDHDLNLWQRMAQLFGKNPDRYQPLQQTMARGDGRAAVAVADCILAVDGSQVDLAPLVGALSPGTYTLTLQRIDVGAGGNAILRYTVAVGTPGAAGRVDGIVPGLYNVAVAAAQRAPGAGPATLTDDTWVLIVPAAAFARASATFGEVVRSTERWPASVPRDDVRALRRVALELLTAPENAP